MNKKVIYIWVRLAQNFYDFLYIPNSRTIKFLKNNEFSFKRKKTKF